MQGGLTMVSDMFNQQLKSQVDGLCSALATLLATSPFQQSQPSSFQSQQQGGQPPSLGYSPTAPVSLFVDAEPGSSGNWWPDGLGIPSSTGAQNQVCYAYFAEARRLAIEVNGRITVYDTLDHHISGFAQQQSGGDSLSFSSQHDLIDVAQLPVVGPPAEPTPSSTPQANEAPPRRQDVDIFAAIEKLGALKERGLLTEEEFTNKKADLLSRL